MIVTLYSKPGCHLCEEARELLDDLALEYEFTIDEVNIEEHAALFAEYRYEIPVVMANGVELARGRIARQHLLPAFRPPDVENS